MCDVKYKDLDVNHQTLQQFQVKCWQNLSVIPPLREEISLNK